MSRTDQSEQSVGRSQSLDSRPRNNVMSSACNGRKSSLTSTGSIGRSACGVTVIPSICAERFGLAKSLVDSSFRRAHISPSKRQCHGAFPARMRSCPSVFSPLPYDYNALEPHIDEQTMRIHHDKHHGTYVNNLNAALESQPDLQKKSIEQLLQNIETIPEAIRTAVRNNGGGHANHTMFWEIMAPGGAKEPSGPWPMRSARRSAASRSSRNSSPRPAPAVSAAGGPG